MVYFLTALLVFPLLLLLHSYIIFPFKMIQLQKPADHSDYPEPEKEVAIIMAVYNEATVLEEKLDSMLNSTYPLQYISIMVGSDASTDETDAILKRYAENYPQIHYQRFEERTGKPQIINHLALKAQAEILVLTDADAIFYPDTLPNLMKPFANEEVGGVQANLITKGPIGQQVALQEINYNQRELKIKRGEGANGAVIGADGTCYAIRRSFFTPVPEGFFVDDFFIFMSILKQGYKTCFAKDAYCNMHISGDSGIQFQRKVRISKGNFQNLSYFRSLVNPFQSFAGYAFFSHKVLRWLGPFLMVIMLAANLLLIAYHELFWVILGFQLGFYSLGLLDLILRKVRWYLVPLRFISHFVLMNLALLFGFFHYLSGPGDGTWDSTPKA